jgi:hypothetical protein
VNDKQSVYPILLASMFNLKAKGMGIGRRCPKLPNNRHNLELNLQEAGILGATLVASNNPPGQVFGFEQGNKGGVGRSVYAKAGGSHILLSISSVKGNRRVLELDTLHEFANASLPEVKGWNGRSGGRDIWCEVLQPLNIVPGPVNESKKRGDEPSLIWQKWSGCGEQGDVFGGNLRGQLLCCHVYYGTLEGVGSTLWMIVIRPIADTGFFKAHWWIRQLSPTDVGASSKCPTKFLCVFVLILPPSL